MEKIYLNNGDIILAEVNGKTLDGQTGSVFIPADARLSLAVQIAEGIQIDVERNTDATWREVPNEEARGHPRG